MTDLFLYYGSSKRMNMGMVYDEVRKELLVRGHYIYSFFDEVTACDGCRVCANGDGCPKFPAPVREALKTCKGIVLFSPIYFFGYNGKTKTFLDHLYSVHLEGKALTSVSLSGSHPSTKECGLDLVEEVLKRTADYTGAVYVRPLNFVTEDKPLKRVSHFNVSRFVDRLERAL